MKCEVWKKPAMENSIVCSDNCQEVRLKMFELGDKYYPTHGCDNCWSDSHTGCTEQCKKEFKESGEFGKDLWSLVRLIYKESK